MTEYLIEAETSAGTLRFSESGFTTRPTESPANMEYAGRIADPGNFERRMALPDGSQSASVSYGDVQIVNDDGGLDGSARDGFDGRALTIRRGAGPALAYPSTYPVVATLTMDMPRWSYGVLSLTVRDALALVRDKPIVAAEYAGNNALPAGVEGTEDDLKGKPKPWAIGKVRNVQPPVVNTSRLIHQCSIDAVTVDAVYDQGVALTSVGTWGTLAALEAATTGAAGSGADIEAGEYGVYSGSDGTYFKRGGAAQGTITADLTGTDTTAADILESILTGPGGLSSPDLDAASFTALTSTAAMGIWTGTSGMTCGQAIDMVLTSVGGWLLPNVSGVFEVGVYAGPGTSSGAITEDDIIDLSVQNIRPPVWSVTVEYQRNWTPSNDIAGAAEARRAWLEQEYRTTAAAETAATLTKHPLAREITIQTVLDSASDAAALASAALGLFDGDDLVLSVTCPAEVAESYRLGQTVTVEHPRFGLSSGVDFVVIGRVEARSRDEIELVLRG